MAEEQQFKRNTAYKFRIGDILVGKPVMNGERFAFLELGDKKIVRVNIIGNIVDRYESLGETKYISLTIDDGSGQVRLKVFGDDTERFKKFFQGQTVVVIGVLRHWNDELYISPEVIREMDTKYLLIRKLETEKEKAVPDFTGDEDTVHSLPDFLNDKFVAERQVVESKWRPAIRGLANTILAILVASALIVLVAYLMGYKSLDNFLDTVFPPVTVETISQ